MGEPVSRNEAIRKIMRHDWVYKPKVFETEEGLAEPEITSIIQPPFTTWDDLTIAASYALIWLEGLGMTKNQLRNAWWAMVDVNHVFSVPYDGLPWETVMLMVDKAMYVAKEMDTVDRGAQQ